MGKIGKIVQVIGPVLDIEFDEEHLPSIYNAVRIKDDEHGIDIIAEVEQHLGVHGRHGPWHGCGRPG